jgi:anaerobic dimethyl sulfoxide reductase subunit C (anchor subunit)
MRGAEWPLIIFTLFAQLAVGMFLVIGTVNFAYLSKPDNLAARAAADRILLAVIVILALAILASFFHIGKPRHAAYAIAHFSRSWLSREIAFLVLFTLLAALSYLLRHAGDGSHSVRLWLAIVTGTVGVIAVISMARVYMLETVPAWNTIATPIQFVSTSLIVGACAAMCLFVLFGGRADAGGPLGGMMRVFLPALLVLMCSSAISFLIHLHGLPGAGIAGAESFRLLTGEHAGVLFLRLSLILASIVLVCILWLTATRPFATSLLVVLCFIVFASELIGRYLFYASYNRVGV